MNSRCYLDHAATSWPKPPGVLDAFVEYQERYGIGAGRGSYRSSQIADSVVQNVRLKIARMIGAASPSNIAFVHNGTAALNLCLQGIARTGDHFVTTAIEHNSVLRPLTMLRREKGIEFTAVACDETGSVDPHVIASAVQTNTRAIIISHASNVTGATQDLKSISQIARHHGLVLIVDAAQSLGYLPVDVSKMGIDALASPGHKGAGGLLGTGFLYLSDNLAGSIKILWPGGTGLNSNDLDSPLHFPEGAESGNLNVPAIAAWEVGLDWIASNWDTQHTALQVRMNRLRTLLRDIPYGRMIETCDTFPSAPVISLLCEGIAPSEYAAILDSSFQIEVRSGLHCSPLIHNFIGSQESGGTLRFSLGHTSTDHDLDLLAEAIASIRDL